MKRSLAEYRRSIKRELRFAGPYSHNIIALHLASIDEHYGLEKANKAIRDLGLDKLGWSVICAAGVTDERDSLLLAEP